MVAHLSAVAESRVQIPAACKYCKAASAATAVATTMILVVSAAEAAKKRKGQKKVTKRKNKVAIKIECAY